MREWGRDEKEEEERKEERIKRKTETFQTIWTKLRITGLFSPRAHTCKQTGIKTRNKTRFTFKNNIYTAMCRRS